jgi:hypothetical protein
MITGFRNVTPFISVGCDQCLAAACCLWRRQIPATSTNLHGVTYITICRETLHSCLSQYHLLSFILCISYSLLSFFIYSFLSILNSFLSSLFLSTPLLFLFYLSVYLFVPSSCIITPSPTPHTCCLLRPISASRVCQFLTLIQLQGMQEGWIFTKAGLLEKPLCAVWNWFYIKSSPFLLPRDLWSSVQL